MINFSTKFCTLYEAQLGLYNYLFSPIVQKVECLSFHFPTLSFLDSISQCWTANYYNHDIINKYKKT